MALALGARAIDLVEVRVTAAPILRLTPQKVQRVLMLKVEVV